MKGVMMRVVLSLERLRLMIFSKSRGSGDSPDR